jgi:lipoprotein
MDNDKFYKGATIVALITIIFTSYSCHKVNNPYQPACDINVEYISDTLQDWMIERVSNNFVKTNKLEVVGMDGFAEYKNIPFWNKMPLYEDFKHSVVCSATALVDFAPITSDKNKPSGDNKNENIKESKYIEEISVRYQLIDGGGIRMSGIDVHDMTKQVKEKGAKHKKK